MTGMEGFKGLFYHDWACFIYDSEQEWQETTGPFIAYGLNTGHRCVYYPGLHSTDQVRTMLVNCGVDVEVQEQNGHLMILEDLLPMDRLSGSKNDRIVQWLVDFSDQTLRDGYSGIFIASELEQKLTSLEEMRAYVELNLRLDQDYFPRFPVTALCHFSSRTTDPVLLRYSLMSHPVIIYGGQVYKNYISRSGNGVNQEEDRWRLWLDTLENKMRAQERLQVLTWVFEGLSQPLLVTTADLELAVVNQAFCRLVGLEREELLALHTGDTELYRQIRDTVTEFETSGRPHRMERVFNCRNLNLHLDLTIEPLPSETGRSYYYVFITDVTDRKCAEEQYRMAAEQYRLIADASFDIVAMVDISQYRFLYVSPSIARLLGYDPSEILGVSCWDYIHPDDRKRVREALRSGAETGESSAEFRFRKADGSYLWIESNGRLIARPSGEKQALVFSHNIDDRKRAEEALKASERRLRQITDNMLDGIFCMSQDKTVTYVSPSLEGIIGYSPEFLKMEASLANIHPDDREEVVKLVNGLFNRLSSGRVEFRARHREGHFVWLESVGKAMGEEQGEVTEVVFATRDISQRKRAEQYLKEQVDYLNTLIDNMNELLYTYDRDLNLTFANSKGYEHLGYHATDIMGHSILDFIPAKARQQVMEEANNRLINGQTSSYETSLLRRDGTLLPVRLKSSPIEENGSITGGLVLAEDITKWIKMEQEMARLAQLHVIGEMAAGIGHEIRNPMTTVQGFLQLLSQNEEFSKYSSYFELMREELERANSIISEFLSLARNKMADLQLRNINNILKSMYPLLQADALLGDKQVRLQVEPVSELLLDEKEIRQLVMNLVRNGLEAMPSGGILTISTKQDPDYVILSIQDEGEGIKTELLSKIGTPFFTTKEHGTGLGLAVCYGIINRHQATMDIITGPQGTTFAVKFPAADGV